MSTVKDIVTIGALCFGGWWALHTYSNDSGDRKAREIPTLEVRISAEEKILNPENHEVLLGKYGHLIRVLVTVKNVGTAKTILHLCESKVRNSDDSCVDEKKENDKELPKKGREEYKKWVVSNFDGPLVVSELLSLTEGKMNFGPPKRFWATRPPWVSDLNKPDTPAIQDIVRADEMRPKAEDTFEFLVPVQGPGVYAIMFTAPVDKKERERMNEEAVRNGEKGRDDPLRWDAITFFEVRNDRGDPNARK